ncbi:hypothetical protein LCS82_07630 [Vibrio harveyi]|uniref:hypothetical protein n=1 Tax=Vibrio harveyi TaxID=669 RepID=UPI003BB5F9E5
MTTQSITSEAFKPRYIVDPKYFAEFGSIVNQTYLEKGRELVCSTSDVVLHGDTEPFGKDLPVHAYVMHRNNMEPKRALEIWDEDTLNAKVEERMESLKREEKEIPVATFWEQYECLPPCRERTLDKFRFFHVMTRVSGDLVNWYALMGDEAFTLIDEASADMNHILDRFFALAEDKFN